MKRRLKSANNKASYQTKRCRVLSKDNYRLTRRNVVLQERDSGNKKRIRELNHNNAKMRKRRKKTGKTILSDPEKKRIALESLALCDAKCISMRNYQALTSGRGRLMWLANLASIYGLKSARAILDAEIYEKMRISFFGNISDDKRSCYIPIAKIVDYMRSVGCTKFLLQADGRIICKKSSLRFQIRGMDDNNRHIVTINNALLDCSESYANLAKYVPTILEGIDDEMCQDFFVSADYKMLLLLLGLNHAASNCSCIYCPYDTKRDVSNLNAIPLQPRFSDVQNEQE